MTEITYNVMYNAFHDRSLKELESNLKHLTMLIDNYSMSLLTDQLQVLVDVIHEKRLKDVKYEDTN